MKAAVPTPERPMMAKEGYSQLSLANGHGGGGGRLGLYPHAGHRFSV